MFLLCTDGLTEGLHGDHLVELLRLSEPADTNRAQRLVELSVHNDGRDNTTALVIQAD